MSSNLPPFGPPSGPPPAGPPPSGPPPSGGPWGAPPPPAHPYPQRPEFLDSGSGGFGPPPPAPPGSSGGGRRRAIIAGGTVVGLAAVAGGAFAVYSMFFATGPQPAEALPDSTVGYVSVDLDPSGKQKLEILEALEKFPAFREEVDLESDDDLRQKLFELIQDEEGICPDVDFGDDIEPWLGDRFGFAAVDLGDDPDEGHGSGVTAVGVVQLSDADAAEDGLAKLRDCVEGASSDDVSSSSEDEFGNEIEGPEVETDEPSESFGWSVQGDWVVIAETEDLATQVTDAAQDDPLSDDEDFEKWTDAAGAPGILTAYAAPEAGELITDALSSMSMAGFPDVDCAIEDEFGGDEFDEDEFGGDDFGQDCGTGDEVDEEMDAMSAVFEGFEGAALTVRFDDGGLEVESASSIDYLGLATVYESDRGDDVVATLPENTAVALGLGFEEGWFTEVTDYVESMSSGLLDVDEALSTLEEETGLQVPEDIETLMGESAAIALGGDFDAADFESDSPAGVPLGIKVKGDPEAITDVIDRLLEGTDLPSEVKDAFGYDSDGDYVVAGFSDDFTQELLEDGELGDTDAYQDVVEESEDASSVFFVNFDAEDWLVRIVEEEEGEEAASNVAPLAAAGMSAWTDDDGVSHSVFRITTE